MLEKIQRFVNWIRPNRGLPVLADNYLELRNNEELKNFDKLMKKLNKELDQCQKLLHRQPYETRLDAFEEFYQIRHFVIEIGENRHNDFMRMVYNDRLVAHHADILILKDRLKRDKMPWTEYMRQRYEDIRESYQLARRYRRQRRQAAQQEYKEFCDRRRAMKKSLKAQKKEAKEAAKRAAKERAQEAAQAQELEVPRPQTARD